MVSSAGTVPWSDPGAARYSRPWGCDQKSVTGDALHGFKEVPAKQEQLLSIPLACRDRVRSHRWPAPHRQGGTNRICMGWTGQDGTDRAGWDRIGSDEMGQRGIGWGEVGWDKN